MPDNVDEKDTASQLRREAERRLTEQTDEMRGPSQLSLEETRRLLHELRVHQIELELQNEELRRAQKDLQAARDRYADLYDFAPVGYMTISEKGIIQQANLTATRLLDVPRSDLIGKPLTRFILAEDQDIHYLNSKTLFDTGGPQVWELRLRGGDETPLWVEIHGTLAHDGDGAPVCHSAITDISERKQAEAALKESEEKFKGLVNNLNVGVYRNTPGAAGKFIEVNPALVSMFGYESREELMARDVSALYMEPSERKVYSDKVQQAGSLRNEELQLKKKDGAPLTGAVSAVAVKDEKGQVKYFDTIIADVTERRQLEAKLRQAQKMESVGQLAGGVAHDFNNKLTTILGFAQLAMGQIEESDPLYGDLKEIVKAGNRSAEIVRQLLAFARKQTIAPEVLQLNDTVKGMLKMLRRLIGEDIDLSWKPGGDLWPVNMDPSQIDQILANLCVNAKDAIDTWGKITIETHNVTLDETYCQDHAGFVPGEYVMLAVSDNGSGMDKETLTNIFEPFYTTKKVGKGTGLGLSTVYGIVKQNNGFINAYSEPGQGTTFKIYLPRHTGDVQEDSEAVQSELPRGQGETIVIVEDEPTVLKVAQRTLKRLGYRVMTFENPVKAVTWAEERQEEIHLLMTDVIMPEMSGKALAEAIEKLQPNTRTLYMSGYTATAIAHQGVLDKGVHFIQKPFGPEGLARKIKEVLEAS